MKRLTFRLHPKWRRVAGGFRLNSTSRTRRLNYPTIKTNLWLFKDLRDYLFNWFAAWWQVSGCEPLIIKLLADAGHLPPAIKLHLVTSLQTVTVRHLSLDMPTASLSTCLWNSECPAECTHTVTLSVYLWEQRKWTTQKPLKAQSKSHQRWGWGGGAYYVWAIKDKVGERGELPADRAQARHLVGQNQQCSPQTDLSLCLENRRQSFAAED